MDITVVLFFICRKKNFFRKKGNKRGGKMNLPFDGYLRRKDAYEAADSGGLLWRKNFAYFIVFFAIPFWICAFAFRMLPGKMQYLSWLFMWYLKPFFDRLILQVISIRFFEPKAALKRLFKGLGKTLKNGLAGDLLWRRFSPFRSSTMPLRVLEQSTKNINKYSGRKKLLNMGGLGYGFFLTFWGLALEAVLLIGELFFVMMIARFFGIEIDLFYSDFIVNSEIYFYALWCFNYIIVETIYVCMGFGVYINSRIEVEGWDIEIMFKNFAEKLKKKKALGVLSIVCLLFIFSPSTAFAENIKPSTEAPLDKLENILTSPDFGGEKDAWDIKLKNPPEKKEKIFISNYNHNKLIRQLEQIFASGLRTIIIISSVIAGIIIFIIAVKLLKNKNIVMINKPVISISHESPGENPQELLDKAIELYKQGNLRIAWGHCTAAAIISLKLYRNLVFPPNATENDCAKIAKAKLIVEEEALKFQELIKTWIRFIYAGLYPQEEDFNEAVAFCKTLAIKPPENEANNG
jgi:hypothetical protein